MSRRWIDVLAPGDFGAAGAPQPAAATESGHDVWLTRHHEQAAIVRAPSERLARQLAARVLGGADANELVVVVVDLDGDPAVLLTGSVGEAADVPPPLSGRDQTP